jgi:hypothetical protein
VECVAISLNERQFLGAESIIGQVRSLPLRVKTGKAQREHMFSGLLPKADIRRAGFDFRVVPIPEVTSR